MKRAILLIGMLLLAVMAVSGCAPPPAEPSVAANFATPTSHPFTKLNTPSPIVTVGITPFMAQPTVTPTNDPRITQPPPPTFTPISPATATLTVTPTVTTVPTERPLEPATPVPTPELTAVAGEGALPSIVIYDEEVHPDWTILRHRGMDYNLEHAFAAHSGEVSLAMKPRKEWSTMFFIVSNETSRAYLREDVLGFSFWLYGNDDWIDREDLLVTVVGSNESPYWIPDDQSVENIYEPLFSETRLYYLGINDDIPPKTWVQVYIWLDDLLFDPDYEYVTGIYIKNDEQFFETALIDELTVYLLPEGAAEGSEE